MLVSDTGCCAQKMMKHSKKTECALRTHPAKDHRQAICTTGRSPLAARAVPAFYLHFIYCGMQFAVVANELNMRIAIIPKENEKSEPFSNRKQVRIFLVWWARVDYASRAAKNSLAGCFCPAGRKAPGRSCSHPPAYVSLTFAQKKTASVSLHQRFFHGRGWIRTTEAEKQQIYSLSPLATREHAHIQFFAVADCLYILPLGGVFVNCFLQLFQKRS